MVEISGNLYKPFQFQLRNDIHEVLRIKAAQQRKTIKQMLNELLEKNLMKGEKK